MDATDYERWRAAAAAGEKRFLMNTPCANGHLGYRYTASNGSCCECQRLAGVRARAARKNGSTGLQSLRLQFVHPDDAQRLKDYAETLRNYRKRNSV